MYSPLFMEVELIDENGLAFVRPVEYNINSKGVGNYGLYDS